MIDFIKEHFNYKYVIPYLAIPTGTWALNHFYSPHLDGFSFVHYFTMFFMAILPPIILFLYSLRIIKHSLTSIEWKAGKLFGIFFLGGLKISFSLLPLAFITIPLMFHFMNQHPDNLPLANQLTELALIPFNFLLYFYIFGAFSVMLSHGNAELHFKKSFFTFKPPYFKWVLVWDLFFYVALTLLKIKSQGLEHPPTILTFFIVLMYALMALTSIFLLVYLASSLDSRKPVQG